MAETNNDSNMQEICAWLIGDEKGNEVFVTVTLKDGQTVTMVGTYERLVFFRETMQALANETKFAVKLVRFGGRVVSETVERKIVTL